jgi:hypothetical protein
MKVAGNSLFSDCLEKNKICGKICIRHKMFQPSLLLLFETPINISRSARLTLEAGADIYVILHGKTVRSSPVCMRVHLKISKSSAQSPIQTLLSKKLLFSTDFLFLGS